MIQKFDKFQGRIKQNLLDKEEVIDLVSLITDMKPSLPDIVGDMNISKLVDNINYYTSEDEVYRISVYFKESDIYHNEDGTTTYGKFKSLFKIGIKKIESGNFKLLEVKDYILLTKNIISEVYPTSKGIIKLNGERISVDDFKNHNDKDDIEEISLIIRIV